MSADDLASCDDCGVGTYPDFDEGTCVEWLEFLFIALCVVKINPMALVEEPLEYSLHDLILLWCDAVIRGDTHQQELRVLTGM